MGGRGGENRRKRTKDILRSDEIYVKHDRRLGLTDEESTVTLLVTSSSLGSLRSDIFEPRTSTESGIFASLSLVFEQFFGQIISKTVKTLSNTNLVVLRHIKREKGVAQKCHCLNSLNAKRLTVGSNT